MENNNSTRVDIIEMVRQTMDAVANNHILAAMEKDQGEYGVALVKLFNEYGIYGMRIYEFLTAFDTLNKMYGKDGRKNDQT